MTTAVQNHIHISSTLEGSGEKAPDIKWLIHDRKMMPTVFMTLRRTKRGNLRNNVILDTGNPVQITNFQYELRIHSDETYTTAQREAFLLAMQGKKVYVVDSVHCNDGEDHTSFVKQMVLDIPEGFNTDIFDLSFYFVRVDLTDATL